MKINKDPKYVRRRRAVLTLPLVLASGIVAGKNIVDNADTDCEGEQQVTVEHNDTLWSLADNVIFDRSVDKSAVVDKIIDQNPGIKVGYLAVGQEVTLPKECR